MSTEQIAWSLVGGLFLIIGFFVSGWMTRTDGNHDHLSKKVAQHDTEIATLKATAASVAADIQEIQVDLHEHARKEEQVLDEILANVRKG